MQHIHFVGLRFQHLVKRAEIFTHTLFHIAMIVILAQRLVVDSILMLGKIDFKMVF
jgi:hypothetical protein